MLDALALALAFAVPQAQDPSAPPTCRIEGTVFDPLHRPLPAAEVWVEQDGLVVARTGSDANGMFVLRPLPRGPSVVRARVRGVCTAGIAVDSFGWSRPYLELVAYPVRTVRGTVHDDEGKPVAGAQVVALPQGPAELACLVAETRSAADGSFFMDDVLPGDMALVAWAPGHEIAYVEDAEDGDCKQDLELANNAAIAIRFALQGATAAQCARARLRCRFELRDQLLPTPPQLVGLPFDASGACELAGVPGRVHVRVTRLDLGGANATSEWGRSPSAIESFEWPFQVVDHGQITGRLRTTDGVPAPGLRVACWPADGQQERFGSPGPVWGTADADGHFALPSPVAEGKPFVLRVVDDDFGVVTESGSEIRGCYRRAHRRDAPHEVSVERGARRTLLLVDGNSAPVPGCTVNLFETPNEQARWMAGGGADRAGRLELGGIELAGAPAPTLRFGAGRVFHSAPLPPAAPHSDPIRVELPALASVGGRVLDADGKPAFGARVRLWEQGSAPLFRLAITDRDGRYRFVGLGPGVCGVSEENGGGVVFQAQTGEDIVADLQRK
jgi:hypothetical protein